ncbi:MAG: helix-turn-helix domain-containing protein, partial [Fibrobacteres bacterium]|nr:helix-turn-helix domain-containing protein [Fibrobacterota bacterium]
KETARLLKFSKRQLQRWIRNKQLNVVRFGRAVRVSHEEIRRIKSIGIHDESADILRSEVGCRVKSRSRRKTGSLWE